MRHGKLLLMGKRNNIPRRYSNSKEACTEIAVRDFTKQMLLDIKTHIGLNTIITFNSTLTNKKII